MLLINPDLPRVRLELGVLYYRLGSYEVARTYLDDALKSPTLPADVRSRAEQFMAEIEKRQSPSRFSGEVFLGWRYQSNANLGPATSLGAAVRPGRQPQPGGDRHIRLGRRQLGADPPHLRSRPPGQGGDRDPAHGLRQPPVPVSAANVSLLDLTTGPRFQAFHGIFEDVSIKPFVTVGYIWVNDTPYYGSYGARPRNRRAADRPAAQHLDLRLAPAELSQTPPTCRPTASSPASQFTGNTTFQYQLHRVVTVFAIGSAQRYETEQTPWQNYQLWGVGGGLRLPLRRPGVQDRACPGPSTCRSTQQWWQYDAPDPIVDPTTTRLQTDTILNLVLSIPFDERTTFSVSGGRFARTATLPNYEFVNNSVMFGVSWRF